MRRDFTKNKFAIKRSAHVPAFLWDKRKPLLITLSLLLILIGGTMAYFYLYRSHFIMTANIVNRLYQAIKSDTQVKPLALEKNVRHKPNLTDDANVEPIHFEFYTSLPQMKVVLSQSAIGNGMENNSAIKHAALTETKNRAKILTSVSATTLAKNHKPVKRKSSLFSASSLEQELKSHLKQENYIIQLGIFHTMASAKRFHEACLKAGLTVSIVKIKLNAKTKTIYRVQQGPFSQKKIKLAQHTLEKAGYKFLVRKTV